MGSPRRGDVEELVQGARAVGEERAVRSVQAAESHVRELESDPVVLDLEPPRVAAPPVGGKGFGECTLSHETCEVDGEIPGELVRRGEIDESAPLGDRRTLRGEIDAPRQGDPIPVLVERVGCGVAARVLGEHLGGGEEQAVERPRAGGAVLQAVARQRAPGCAGHLLGDRRCDREPVGEGLQPLPERARRLVEGEPGRGEAVDREGVGLEIEAGDGRVGSEVGVVGQEIDEREVSAVEALEPRGEPGKMVGDAVLPVDPVVTLQRAQGRGLCGPRTAPRRRRSSGWRDR